MKNKLVKYKILLVLFTLLLSTNISFGKEEKPEPPDDFTVTPHIANYGLFKWKVHESAGIRGFIVYFFHGKSENTSEFEVLDTIHVTDPNLKKENGFHFIYLHVTKGEYSFYITAFNQFGESEPSDIVFKVMGEDDVPIHFTSRPDTIGFVSEKYEYEAKANVSTGGLIYYEIKDGPPGMGIEHESGYLSWTPKEEGRYHIIIHAYLALNPSIFLPQDWHLNIKKCKKDSYITGTLKYPNGENVESGHVIIYKKSEQSEPDLYSNIEFSDGYFTEKVDEGIYYLRFEGDKIKPEWYENVYEKGEAKPINIKCGDEKNVDVVVDKFIISESYIVKGKVTREKDGLPVAYAPIKFIGRNNQTEEVKKGAISNQDGFYEISLQGDLNYIASFPAWENYLSQFYDRADNASEATIIELTSDRENIDFVLKEKPEFQNKLYCVVKDNEGNKVGNINVIAFKIDSIHLMQYISRQASKDNSDIFKFENLEEGKYILLVYSEEISSRKIPGYYVVNKTVSRTWRDATKIEINATTEKDDIIIKIPSLTAQEIGRGTISGVVKAGETFIIDSEVINEGDPIVGAIVYALDKESNVRNFTKTDNMGRYELRNMKAGKYNILIDKVGFYPNNYEIELIEDNSNVNNEVKMYSIIYSVPQDEKLKIELYPNPVSNLLNITFKENPNNIKITIFNILGVIVSSNNYEFYNAQTGINLNVLNYNSGFYYLKIESNLNSSVYPFVISR